MVSGVSFLAGWEFDIEILKQLKPEWPPQTLESDLVVQEKVRVVELSGIEPLTSTMPL